MKKNIIVKQTVWYGAMKIVLKYWKFGFAIVCFAVALYILMTNILVILVFLGMCTTIIWLYWKEIVSLWSRLEFG